MKRLSEVSLRGSLGNVLDLDQCSITIAGTHRSGTTSGPQKGRQRHPTGSEDAVVLSIRSLLIITGSG